MKMLITLLFSLLTLTTQAQDVSFNGNKPAILIDVRTPEEFAAGHINGAINIPVEQIGQGIQTIKTLNKDSSILLYCRSGRRSASARATLEQLGYRHVTDGGGMASLAQSLKTCSAKTC